MEFENVKDAIKFMLELSEKGATMKTTELTPQSTTTRKCTEKPCIQCVTC